MTESHPTLHLRSGREYTIRRGHPWVFSGAFRELPQDIPPGAVADVVSSSGEWIARGHVNVRNSLAFRVLTLDPDETIDTPFYARRIARALALRALLPASVNAYRLVNAEADYLPGLIVDRYDRWLSVQFHTAGADRDRPHILAALEQVVRPDGILARDDIKARAREGLALGGASLAAGTVPETLTIIEHDVHYLVDPWHGQKTGFFLDQRDKRALIGDAALHAHSLLNTFSYSGGFALAALARNPALHTVNVDSSDAALDLARRNYALNSHDPAAHEFTASDVNRFLQQCAHEGRAFDVVIVDPPAFAKNLSMKDRALRGYETLNAHAARTVAPNGLLLTCSCSGGVNAADFENAVQLGVSRATRSAQLLATFGPSIDHPTLPGFAEDRYLKALLLRLS
ncbi:MAG: 23S rRNA (cytosine(1962)-C(5))-methyltransferase [Ktedonobacterales bacterium]|jgi:23S rRNA (cytosine1962-C5)-methyltransferase|nr:MAG: 23S rRNA (cytosine(1962)-C(5))-methyltransferase [Ktedonobacterales bacterium]